MAIGDNYDVRFLRRAALRWPEVFGIPRPYVAHERVRARRGGTVSTDGVDGRQRRKVATSKTAHGSKTEK